MFDFLWTRLLCMLHTFSFAKIIKLCYSIAGPPKALDEDETKFLDKIRAGRSGSPAPSNFPGKF